MSVLLIDLGSGSRDDRAQTLLLASSLLARGDVCVLACPEGDRLAEAAALRNVPVAPLSGRMPGAGRMPSLGVWLKLRRLVRERGITLAHTLDEAALLPGALLRRRAGVPLVHSLRPLPEKRPKWASWALRQADAMVDTGAGLPAGAGEELDTSRMKTILPAVSPPGLGICPPRRERGDGRFIFVAAGDLIPEKDWHALIQAIAYLQNMAIDLPPWEVRVVGEGPQFYDLLDLAESLGVQPRISLLGGQNRRNFLPDADAVVIATASGAGDIPLILDAWTCGLPVACTALPAHQAAGEEKVSLLLSPPSHPVALAGSMLRLMQEPDMCTRLVQGGKEAVAHFGADRMAEAYSLLYAGVRNRAALARADANAN